MKSQKIIIGFAAIIILLTTGISAKRFFADNSVPNIEMDPLPKEDQHADSYENLDTMKALAANMERILSDNRELTESNKKLQDQLTGITEEISAEVKKRVQYATEDDYNAKIKPLFGRLNNLESKMRKSLGYPALSKSSKTTDQLGSKKKRFEETKLQSTTPSDRSFDFPIGGYPVGGVMNKKPKKQEYVWIDDEATAIDMDASVTQSSLDKLKKKSKKVLNKGGKQTYEILGKVENEIPSPAYTLHRGLTIVNAQTVTALIGRVPVKGVVQDAYPFKVIIGGQNLAANGIEVPELAGMVFGGLSKGDPSISCVRGTIHYATYVFHDGTISTYPKGKGSSADYDSSHNLGYLSDQRGVQCVSGVKITNNEKFLAGGVLASAVDAAGRVFSLNETSSSSSPIGGVTQTSVTGSKWNAFLGGLVSGGANEISSLMREEYRNRFNVFYADVGSYVSLHIEQEIPIDYKQNGRKTNHEFSINSSNNSSIIPFD